MTPRAAAMLRAALAACARRPQHGGLAAGAPPPAAAAAPSALCAWDWHAACALAGVSPAHAGGPGWQRARALSGHSAVPPGAWPTWGLPVPWALAAPWRCGRLALSWRLPWPRRECSQRTSEPGAGLWGTDRGCAAPAHADNPGRGPGMATCAAAAAPGAAAARGGAALHGPQHASSGGLASLRRPGAAAAARAGCAGADGLADGGWLLARELHQMLHSLGPQAVRERFSPELARQARTQALAAAWHW